MFRKLHVKAAPYNLFASNVNRILTTLDIRYKLKQILQHSVIYARRPSVDESVGLF